VELACSVLHVIDGGRRVDSRAGGGSTGSRAADSDSRQRERREVERKRRYVNHRIL